MLETKEIKSVEVLGKSFVNKEIVDLYIKFLLDRDLHLSPECAFNILYETLILLEGAFYKGKDTGEKHGLTLDEILSGLEKEGDQIKCCLSKDPEFNKKQVLEILRLLINSGYVHLVKIDEPKEFAISHKGAVILKILSDNKFENVEPTFTTLNKFVFGKEVVETIVPFLEEIDEYLEYNRQEILYGDLPNQSIVKFSLGERPYKDVITVVIRKYPFEEDGRILYITGELNLRGKNAPQYINAFLPFNGIEIIYSKDNKMLYVTFEHPNNKIFVNLGFSKDEIYSEQEIDTIENIKNILESIWKKV